MHIDISVYDVREPLIYRYFLGDEVRRWTLCRGLPASSLASSVDREPLYHYHCVLSLRSRHHVGMGLINLRRILEALQT